MAAAPLTPAQTELVNSLSQDEIPIKLRCAICSKLAVNAFRLPCCDQAICESCQSNLPSSCPVCEHSPVAAEDCKPHKSLRTTIRVFLRTEEKKREALRQKEIQDTPPVAPVDTTASTPALEPLPQPQIDVTPEVHQEVPEAVNTEAPELQEQEDVAVNENLSGEAPEDIPQQSIEEIPPGQEPSEEPEANGEDPANGEGQQALEKVDDEEAAEGQDTLQQTPGFGMGMGFDPSAMGFPNMGMMGQGADFNQMQQMMMAMQNGMGPNAFGGFPMMGMPGMSMDPMAMQNMFMNGGFGAQGMGMNGMNMGMGMGGFDSGVGGSGGFNNGWNGQQSWNIGQDNFNPNATSSMGDFVGANNSGFHPQHHASTGFNHQGNYGRGANQYNDYGHNQGYHPRGRGRGRGGYGYGYGRGGHQGGYQNNQNLPDPFFQNTSAGASNIPPNGPRADTTGTTATLENNNVDEFGRELRAPEATEDEAAEGDLDTSSKALPPTDDAVAPENDKDPDDSIGAVAQPQGQNYPGESKDYDNVGDDDSSAPRPIQTLDDLQASSRTANGYSYSNGVAQVNNQHHPVVAPPINAPTGPKAMRAGLPNTSLVNLRGRGGFFGATGGRGGFGRGNYVDVNGGGANAADQASASPAHAANVGDQEPLTTESNEQPEERSRSYSRSRSESRTRSRSRSSRSHDRDRRHRRHHRSHRHRSVSEGSEDEERRRSDRKRKHSKYDEQDEPQQQPQQPEETADIELPEDLGGDEEEFEVEREKERERELERDRERDREVERSRSQSPAESRRESHHRSSRRERDRDRDRDRRDRDRERDRSRERDYKVSSSSAHKHRSSHRSHRERSRDRDRDRERERERDRDRDRGDRRDRDREYERSRDKDREREYDYESRERERDRDYDRERDREHRHRRHHSSNPSAAHSPRLTTALDEVPNTYNKSENLPPTQPSNSNNNNEIKIPSGPRAMNGSGSSNSNGLEIKGSASNANTNLRRGSAFDENRPPSFRTQHQSQRSSFSKPSSNTPAQPSAPPTGPKNSSSAIDPHTQEREARNRERLLKEAQRMAGLAGIVGDSGGRKRGRDDFGGDGGGGGRKNKRF